MRRHRSHVGILCDLTAGTGGVSHTHEVVVVALVPVEHHIDAVVDETEVNTEVKLMFFLVGQLAVGNFVERKTEFVGIGNGAPRLVRIVDCSGI